MWAVVVVREERRILYDTEERWGGPPAVPTRTWSALGLVFVQRDLGVS